MTDTKHCSSEQVSQAIAFYGTTKCVVLFKIKKLLCLLLLFPHMRLCILFSVSGNIQVNSIELMSILATDE